MMCSIMYIYNVLKMSNDFVDLIKICTKMLYITYISTKFVETFLR